MNGKRKLRFLHLHSSFHLGGKERRAVQLMNAFGDRVEHTVISAIPEALDAAHAVSSRVWASYPRDFPSLKGKPSPPRLQRIARAMEGFDLVLTYNWGAMDAVMAHRVFGRHYKLPPLVHHEDGFNTDEALKLKPMRNLYRRAALENVSALVVPSRQLEAIALQAWHQLRGKVFRIVNGIATADYAGKAKPDALPRVIKHSGELWLGTFAGLRPVKNLPRLVRVFAALPEQWHLVILGEGPEREAILAEAMRLDVGYRVHLPGFVDEPAKVIGLFDLFALSSDSEQFPISVVEAMAAGLAVAAPDVGDIKAMLSPENRRFIARPGDEGGLAAAIEALADGPVLRQSIGQANRHRARAEYDEAAMIAAYRRLYASAMRRNDLD
jgi:glycosyltransferase involved in cell wall biosynthesis